ncbi:hypothetical protein NW762_010607 [Fusarium torreyae]|uniref:Uncharacterized protein n=1 Tax=Fusarium torreyae TaxID=1237075 RepID=A0A9W8VAB8_9HYPO|nr:hypothetical protein NW762_010607 [Fusarium torreyae]
MVSAARKQQNVKAQQRFRELPHPVISGMPTKRGSKRERQKRRVEELEKTVENLVPLPSNSSEGGQYQRRPDPQDVLFGYGLVLDDTALERVTAGQVTLKDILKTGLKAHGLLPSSSTITPEEPQGTSNHDRILVPQNGMHAHPDSLPDVYFNQLRVKQVDTVAAFRSNAEPLGISFENLINPYA